MRQTRSTDCLKNWYKRNIRVILTPRCLAKANWLNDIFTLTKSEKRSVWGKEGLRFWQAIFEMPIKKPDIK